LRPSVPAQPCSRLSWSQDTFAYSDYHDAPVDRFRGLEAGHRATVQLNANGVVIRPEVAGAQIEKELGAANNHNDRRQRWVRRWKWIGYDQPCNGSGAETGKSTRDSGKQSKTPVLRRFHGSAKIASAVVQRLAGLLDAKVTIAIEIEAEIPTGAPDNVVRTVTENCRTLKFENSGFEES
jgi:hypothetical protein